MTADERWPGGWIGGALVAAGICTTACGPSDSGDGGPGDVGRALATGVIAAVERAAPLAEPFRCAELASAQTDGPRGPVAPELSRRAGRTLVVDGDELRMGPGRRDERDRTVVAGVVADARGASAATLTQLGRVRAEFERADVELVVSLGGMGTTEAELSQVLGALGRDATWVVWAIPGERESIQAHRAAIAGLAAAGYPIFDGARLRMVEIDGVILASYPGAEEAGQLLGGADGCVHRPGDGSALAARLASRKGARVWATHSPPRQAGALAGDAALGGVHIGELALAEALPAARADLLLHGLVDEAALGPGDGASTLADGDRPAILGSGPVEAMPIAGPNGAVFAGAALIVRLTPGQVSWRRIRFPAGGSISP